MQNDVAIVLKLEWYDESQVVLSSYTSSYAALAKTRKIVYSGQNQTITTTYVATKSLSDLQDRYSSHSDTLRMVSSPLSILR